MRVSVLIGLLLRTLRARTRATNRPMPYDGYPERRSEAADPLQRVRIAYEPIAARIAVTRTPAVNDERETAHPQTSRITPAASRRSVERVLPPRRPASRS